jgi:hypothetical protein
VAPTLLSLLLGSCDGWLNAQIDKDDNRNPINISTTIL